MRGKYSPTVSAAYSRNQEWWTLYAATCTERIHYDPDGYDEYGYDLNDLDRAGNYEYQYYCNHDDYGNNFNYNDALNAWGFDGTKPVRI